MARQPLGGRVYAVVFAGGCVGGAARMAIDTAIEAGPWAWDIIAINVVGSAILGALLGWLASRVVPWWAPALGPGLLGGFTTFSALAAPHPHQAIPAAATMLITLVAAPIAAAGGWLVGERVGAARRQVPPMAEDDAIEAAVEGFTPPAVDR